MSEFRKYNVADTNPSPGDIRITSYQVILDQGLHTQTPLGAGGGNIWIKWTRYETMEGGRVGGTWRISNTTKGIRFNLEKFLRQTKYIYAVYELPHEGLYNFMQFPTYPYFLPPVFNSFQASYLRKSKFYKIRLNLNKIDIPFESYPISGSN